MTLPRTVEQVEEVVVALRRSGSGRVAVLGDLSGHWLPVARTLSRLGIRFDNLELPRALLAWPDDLTVVQVGDLVHKGPDSTLIVAVVHDLLVPTGRWVQLIGNHEAHYLPDGVRFWDRELTPPIAGALVQMAADGRMVPSAAVVDAEGQATVITHGGVSVPLWERLGCPSGPDGARWLVETLNGKATGSTDGVFTPGMMLGSQREPGVVWTEALTELRVPWLRHVNDGGHMPFSQVHGHSSALWFTTRGQRRIPDVLAGSTVVERGTRHEITVVGRHQIVGIDPGATERRAVTPRPRMLTGTAVW